jgi:hypothetical protein
MEWMMSLGWAGMLLGIALLVAFIVLVVALIRWVWRAGSR